MRRNYISPEFDHKYQFGSYTMIEKSSFFGSKMLEIEDSIDISLQNIIYYQNLKKEQIDIGIESSLPPISYSSSIDKNLNHKLSIDDSQLLSQKEDKTMYILEISYLEIFKNFLFATLKEARTFEGLKSQMSYYGDVDFSIKEYIDKNILSRYKFERLDLYLDYKDLRNQNVLMFSNSWNLNSFKPENQLSRFQIDTRDSILKINFNQEKSSKSFSFEYYFNLFWKKL